MPAATVPEPDRRRYGTGTAWQVLGRLVHGLSALAALTLLTRELGVAAVGVYASFFQLLMTLEVLVDGGSALALLRRSSREPAAFRAVLAQAFRLRALLAGCGLALFLLYARLQDPEALGNPWLYAAGASLFAQTAGAAGIAFHLRLEFGILAAVRSAGALLGLLLLALLLRSGFHDPFLLLAATACGRAAVQGGTFLAALPLLRRWPGGEPAPPGYVRESLTLGAGNLLRDAYGRVDLLLLRALAGETAAGLYAPAKAALQLALMLPSYVLTVALPRLSADAGRDPAAFHCRLRDLARTFTAIAWPAALLALPLPPLLLPLLFGPDYSEAAGALRILGGAAALAWTGSVFVTGLIAAGRAREVLRLSALGLALDLALCLAAIPALGLEGAAGARLATEALVLLLAWRELRRLPRGAAAVTPG